MVPARTSSINGRSSGSSRLARIHRVPRPRGRKCVHILYFHGVALDTTRQAMLTASGCQPLSPYARWRTRSAKRPSIGTIDQKPSQSWATIPGAVHLPERLQLRFHALLRGVRQRGPMPLSPPRILKPLQDSLLSTFSFAGLPGIRPHLTTCACSALAHFAFQASRGTLPVLTSDICILCPSPDSISLGACPGEMGWCVWYPRFRGDGSG